MATYRDSDKILEAMTQAREKELGELYRRRKDEIHSSIAEMYAKYKQGDALTLADMTKYNRLQKQYESLNEILVGTYADVNHSVRFERQRQYLENYYRSAYILEFESQQKLGFGKISKSVIDAAIQNPIKDLSLPAVLEKNRAQIAYNTRVNVAQGLMAGEGYNKMAKRLDDIMDIDMKKAQLVARQEARRAQTIGRESAFQQAESQGVVVNRIWDATLDGKTRSEHQSIDGQQADKDGYFHYGTDMAKGPGLWSSTKMNIRCRCAVVGEVEGYDRESRRARNNDGTTSVIPYKTYEEWYAGRIE